jgi:putative NIF3 family GTP cyclohydrolase 1 type 2
MSRRYLLALLLLFPFTATLLAAAEPPTAAQVVERITKNVNCPWSERTVDTFKAGDPDTPVTGIATTFMATYDVLRRAKEAGCNLIITHEPTFYHGQDDTSRIEGHTVLKAKRKFLEENKLVVWRFHDHIHRHAPDGIIEGMVDALGWRENRKPGETVVFEIPKTTVRDLARKLEKRFGVKTMRVVGRADMTVTKVGFSAGAPGSAAQIEMLHREDVEVLLAGETREWETVEYVRDAADAGLPKALILMNHAISEEAGMKWCADWLKKFVPEVPIKFIPAGYPFWSP